MRERPEEERMPPWVSVLPNAALRWGVARELLPLFAPPAPAASEKLPALSPLYALSATEQFMARYAFAAPFDPDALLGLWERCGTDAGTRRLCRRGLENARQLRAGARPPDAIRWLPLGGDAEAELAAERAERSTRAAP
jgi:hypothetical protein